MGRGCCSCFAYRLLAFVVSFCLITSPLTAYSTKTKKVKDQVAEFHPDFEGQDYEGLGWFKEAEKAVQDLQEKIKETNLGKLAEYDLEKVILDYHHFYQRAKAEALALKNRVGQEKFLDLLDKDKVFFKDPELGTLKFTMADGVPVGRVVHKPSGVSLLFAPKNIEDHNSTDIKKYKARQHFDSGRSRDNKKIVIDGKKRKYRAGRDTIVIWTDDSDNFKSEDVELHKRPKLGTKEWWQEWWHATISKPKRYQAVSGFSIGAIQAVTGYLISGIIYLINPEAYATPEQIQTLHAAGVLNFLFGATLGTLTDTFRQWRQRGGLFAKTLKSASISLAFALSLRVMGPQGFATINIFDPTLGLLPWLSLAHIMQNMTANNLLKVAAYQWSEVHDAERNSEGKFKLHIPYGISKDKEGWKFKKKTFETFLKQKDMNLHVISLLPMNSLRLLDLLIFSMAASALANGSYTQSESAAVTLTSMLFLWLAIPFSYGGVNWWAQKYYPAAAKKVGTQEGYEHVTSPMTRKMASKTINGLQKTGAWIKAWTGRNKAQKSACGSVLESVDKTDKDL